MIKFNTHLETPSPFYLAYNENNEFCEKLSEYAFDKVFFITEKKLFELYQNGLYQAIKENFHCELQIIPSGELSKSFDSINLLGDSLMNKGISKNSILLAFGGGVIGNLVGMVAGLLFRGIRFIEIPTNMTSQTDSTLSNKQAVNSVPFHSII